MGKNEFEDGKLESEAKNEKKSNNKKMKILVGLASAILIIAVVFAISYTSRARAIEKADALISIEKYDEGIAIYDKLLSRKYSESLMNKRSAAVEIKEADENLKIGLESYEKGDINKAVRLLNRVPREDEKRYKLASEELRNIEETVLIDVNQLIEDGDLDGANQIVNNYLKADSKNIKIQNAKEAIRFKKSEIAKKDKTTEGDQEDQDDQENQDDQEKQEDIDTREDKKTELEDKKQDKKENKNTNVKELANNIVGTYQSIVAGKANLRDGSSLSSTIVSVLRSGDEVYIHDTYIESSERIWCYVSTQKNGYTESGWISYNTMNYNIQ